MKSALLDLDIRADQQQLHDAADDSVASRNAVLLGKLYSVTSRWTSFVATNRDGSVARPIDSYDALAGDLHLLAAPKPYITPSRSWLSGLRPGQSKVASTPRSAHVELSPSTFDVSYENIFPASYATAPVPVPSHPHMSHNATPPVLDVQPH